MKTKKPKLVLWGYKPGTANVPIKLTNDTSHAEMKGRELYGWTVAVYKVGEEPTQLANRARREQFPDKSVTVEVTLTRHAGAGDYSFRISRPGHPGFSSDGYDLSDKRWNKEFQDLLAEELMSCLPGYNIGG